MMLHQDRIRRRSIDSEKREGSIARLEAAGIFLIFGLFSAAKLVLTYLKRSAGKGNPPETGW